MEKASIDKRKKAESAFASSSNKKDKKGNIIRQDVTCECILWVWLFYMLISLIDFTLVLIKLSDQ